MENKKWIKISAVCLVVSLLAIIPLIGVIKISRFSLPFNLKPAPKPDAVNLGYSPPVDKSPGGWFYPIPFNEPSLGFLEYNNDFNGYHLAVDINCQKGEPVHALAGGRVLISRTDLNSYGGVNKPGGALVILHQTSDGEAFKALYGHLDDIKVKEGDTVSAAQVLGSVNEVSHPHFGIHPGASLSSFPCLGYTRDRSNPQGWVNPLEFLNQHSPD